MNPDDWECRLLEDIGEANKLENTLLLELPLLLEMLLLLLQFAVRFVAVNVSSKTGAID